ncbi:MAG: hypothetical protein A3I38_03120 [Candidatus Wildermuthbacteria bacterium RIFCSPLOWO2_02_FULL_47_10]|nr:MAG: hypothetical protein A3I38_03120 [Candidatus Wildermuthbacteria bacterium RIFCSPLOWO2_02_FULL_47_10]
MEPILIFSVLIFAGSLVLLAYLFIIWKKINELSGQEKDARGQSINLEAQLQECQKILREEIAKAKNALQLKSEELTAIGEELEKFRSAAVGRELRMTELKKLILVRQNGKEDKAEPGSILLPHVKLEDSEAAMLNLLEDVKEAQENAEEEKKRTLAVIGGLTDGILVFDDVGKVSLANRKAEEFLGLKSSDLAGKTAGELSKTPPLSFLSEILLQGQERSPRKDLVLRGDLIVEVSCLPLFLDGQRLGLIVVMHDVTRERLVEKIKTEFVSLSAHQLRTPLSAIKWTLKMVLEGDLGKLTKEQAELLQKSYQSNERMIRLINELLEVTRMEDGKYLSNPIPTRFESIAESTVNFFQEEAGHKSLKLVYDKPETALPAINIDVEKMRIVMANLLDNAIRYTLPGGQVTVSLKYDKKGIECSVRDTGIGIPENQAKRIFERFYRGSNAIRMETDGSGLGLYIAKNIIEAHGGKMWFESKENIGSTFTFWLPEA